MIEWWYAMTLAEQIFATVGIAATVLLVIQVVMMVIGAAGNSADAADAGDVAGDGGFDLDTPGGELDVPDLDVPELDMPDLDIDITELDMPDLDVPDGDMPELDMPDGGEAPREGAQGRAGSGLRLFTMQGIVSFAAIFGWSGLAMLKGGFSLLLAALLALVFGFLAMMLMAVVMRWMAGLQEDGTFNIRSCFGQTATVYLPIYPKRSQAGKVSLQLTDRYLELDAVTDTDHRLETGTKVVVVGFADGNTVVVID